MDNFDDELKSSFLDEARQGLDDAEQCFLDLEGKRGDPKVLETLFRLAHNLKGTSRAVGFGDMAEFTHELENLLLKLKNNQLSVEDHVVTLLLECNDHLRSMVETLSADLNAHIDSSDLLTKITGVLAGQVPTEIHVHTEAPTPTDIPNEASIPSADAHQWAQDDEASSAPSFGTDASNPHLTEASPAAVVDLQPEHLPHPTPSTDKAPQASPHDDDKKGKAAVQEESIRVSLPRLDRLNNFVGELVILQTVLEQQGLDVASPLMQKTIWQLGKITKEIQDISMSLRMIPLKQTFQKMQRIVRDTSKALEKKVEFTILGEETEVDRTVLEHLGDPLVHMVRNACDHGLEMPADRVASGKTDVGHIVLAAFHQGNNLVIEIRDDGRGLDADKLRRKAVEKGIIRDGDLLSDHEAIQLIFRPGYSTKDQVSEISGRGVGLDVVKTNIERMSGEVQLFSEVGKGSTFRIVLPLTLAIIDGMVAVAGEERYVIPVAQVQETLKPKPGEVKRSSVIGEVFVLRDETIPVYRIQSLLGRTHKPDSVAEGIIIISRNQSRSFAVLVDDIVRQQQVVIKKLGPEIRNKKGLTGSAILGDGKPALILDLFDLTEMNARAAAPTTTASRAPLRGAA